MGDLQSQLLFILQIAVDIAGWTTVRAPYRGRHTSAGGFARHRKRVYSEPSRDAPHTKNLFVAFVNLDLCGLVGESVT